VVKKHKKKKELPPELKRNIWKPGQSGNPKGRPPNIIPNALRELTLKSYRDIIQTVVSGNKDALLAIIADESKSVLEIGIARAYFNAMRDGDVETIERLTARIVGKIPDELNVNAVTENKNLNINANGNIDPTLLKSALAKLNEEV
jgi:hypothetical protein